MYTANGNISDLRPEVNGVFVASGRRSATEYLVMRASQIGCLTWAAGAMRNGMFGKAVSDSDALQCELTAALLEQAIGTDDSEAAAAFWRLPSRVREALCDFDRSLYNLRRA